MREIRKRLRPIIQKLVEMIVEEDVFGLQPSKPPVFMRNELTANKRWAFRSNPDKVRSFREWLDSQLRSGLAVVEGPVQQPWTNTFIHSAFRQGLVRSFIDSRKKGVEPETPGFRTGAQEQFLRMAFAQPERLSKVELLYTRAFEELKGITQQMSKDMGRVLAEGLTHGKGAREIARDLRQQVGLGQSRAMRIARTEIINAHAEGQLDGFEELGIEEVGLLAEWITAGDDRVCERCAEREGKVYTVDEARGLIPLHPNCRCAWKPVVKE